MKNEKSETQNTKSDSYTIKYSSIVFNVGIITGLLLCFFTILLLEQHGFKVADFKLNFQDSNLWIIPKLGIFITLLVVILIGAIFGKRNLNGQYEFKQKYKFLSKPLQLILFFAYLQFGFLLGVLFILFIAK